MFNNYAELVIRTRNQGLSTIAMGVRPSTGMLKTTVAIRSDYINLEALKAKGIAGVV